MNDPLRKFFRRYGEALQQYLCESDESVLEQAHELGRAGLAGKMGILDMVRTHETARKELIPASSNHKAGEADDTAGEETFLLAALACFEAEHRGFGETSRQLQQAIAALERRNLDLAGVNRRLESEIQDHRRTEHELQISEARLRAIFENSPAVIFLKDTQGRYLRVNRRFERLFGLSRRQVLGRTDQDLFPPKQAAAFRANDRKVLRAGKALEFEEVASYRDGVHVSIVSKFPLRDPKGIIYALGGIVTDITRRKQVEEALRQSEEHYRQVFSEAQAMQENLRRLSEQVLRVQEEERLRISRELHDEIGQSLTAVSMMLAKWNHSHFAASDAGARKKFATIQRLLGETMDNVHRFARELRPAMLDELGLLPALRSHCKAFAQRTGLRVTFRADPVAEQLTAEQKTALFRVAQESLTNVAKHARASRVSVRLQADGDRIGLEVADNGRSFSHTPDRARRGHRGLGLLGMQERVRLVNGTFSVTPRRGHGTAVRVLLSIDPSPRTVQSQYPRPSAPKPRVLNPSAVRDELSSAGINGYPYGNDPGSPR